MRLLILILPVLAGMFFTGCKKDPDEQRLSWSTEAPLSIPYRQRIQRFEKNNLIRNCSFETGKIYEVDSLKTSFVIDGWQQMGEHVKWVDIRNEDIYRKNEAFSGYRSIKIVRNHANETDEEGEGVLSEFVKVIPGNYSFSFYTKLENVRPVKNRLGIKMNDAIDIQLKFFDRNKNEISATASFPQENQTINNSFKSLSFANFSTIPSFAWGNIIGKSADFPFPDGDIPTNAHYMKIFIGLKGTGTMWIDSVNFSYTKKNFSVEERMLSYTDTNMILSPVIIPAPKMMERLESVVLFDPSDTTTLPVIVIPDDADITTRKAASLLQQALSFIITDGKKGPVVRILSAQHIQTKSKGLTFILGKTSLYQKDQHALPVSKIAGHPQGYYIFTPHERPDVVFLGGNTSDGIYYAVLSAIQLIDGKQPVFHNAQIIDYPDFENRYFTLGDLTDNSETGPLAEASSDMAGYKMNGVFCKMVTMQDLTGDSPLNDYKNKISSLPVFKVGVISADRMAASQVINGTFIFAPRWILPIDSTLGYPCDMNLTFPDSGLAPGTLLIAPVYNNYLMNYQYNMNQAAMNLSFSTFLYSGSSFFSLNTDDADFAGFYAYTHSKPVFMDNSMLASTIWGQYNGAYPYYPGKLRLYNIFEPFMNNGIREHRSQLDTSLYWVNLPANSELNRIRLATAADFMWNTKNYDPDYSLWKVLVSRYGINVARELIHFASQYGLILETELRLQKNEQIQRNLKKIREDLSVLSVSARSVEKMLGTEHPLVKDIRSLSTQLRARLEHLSSSMVSNP
jgi:hypothetical protein